RYERGGSYTVTLTVSGADGTSDASTQEISVSEGLSAAFTPIVREDRALTVEFVNESSGPVATYRWSFGDGAASDQASPVHTYVEGGVYTVTLTVVGADGISTDETSTQIEVIGRIEEVPPELPGQIEPGSLNAAPVVPAFNRERLRGVYESGLERGNRAQVFAWAGDDVLQRAGVLTPFATGEFRLGGNADLQTIIDWYNRADLGGRTSFNQESVAQAANWTAQDILAPFNADPARCQEGEAPITCALRITQPAVLLVSVGYHDAQSGTNLGTFRASLNEIVQIAAERGVIPVLITVPPLEASDNERLIGINEVIIQVANEARVPVVNVWRAVNELSGSGDGGSALGDATGDPAGDGGGVVVSGEGGGFTASPSGPGDLSEEAVRAYGVNAANRAILRTLSNLRETVFPDAAQ
ncbi:MAG: PKD domain-containing protein, partial [Chloroflexi bacterium]|nr:PKD domain-containing protein [Chloroflexota bacterium]